VSRTRATTASRRVPFVSCGFVATRGLASG